jgi:DNA polymerase-3 subunit gamma/tau
MNLFGEEEAKQYQVLARKYRPKTLSTLIGQDVLVRTISNAIEMNKIPHAFVLTGIRGVGKTSTARIIARSLLCIGADGKNTQPTKEPCGVCDNCKSIAEDRHVDVTEVDAASRTGVGDIREIIDQVVYAPVQGRYKIFIIDEVHMLSKNAFNALLKTLEEPPAHVKFIFATTEIRKIPVTILSRCMRFDLPRVAADVLVKHFGYVAENEGAKITTEALTLIAKASEGSVRDGLSLLDQAISISNHDEISLEKVRNMLGLADRERVYDLFENIIEGQAEGAIKIIRELYNLGVEPVIALQDLLEVVHFVTQTKISEEFLESSFLTESEKKLGKKFADKLEISYLSRLWQMLSKAISEARYVANSLIAAEMILIRICYGAGLPTPEQILNKLDFSGGVAAQINNSQNSVNNQNNLNVNLAAQKKTEFLAETPTEQSQKKPVVAKVLEQKVNEIIDESEMPEFEAQDYLLPEPAKEVSYQPQENHTQKSYTTEQASNAPKTFVELVNLFKQKSEVFTAAWLEDVTLVEYNVAERKIEYIPSNVTPKTLSAEITEKLQQWLGERWFVVISSGLNAANSNLKSVRTEKEEQLEKRKDAAVQDNFVKEILETFPNSKVINVSEVFESQPLAANS